MEDTTDNIFTYNDLIDEIIRKIKLINNTKSNGTLTFKFKNGITKKEMFESDEFNFITDPFQEIKDAWYKCKDNFDGYLKEGTCTTILFNMSLPNTNKPCFSIYQARGKSVKNISLLQDFIC